MVGEPWEGMTIGMQPNLARNMCIMLGNISTQIFKMAEIIDNAYPDPGKTKKAPTWSDYLYANSTPEQLAVQNLTQINNDLTRINEALIRALPRKVRARPDESGRWGKVAYNAEEDADDGQQPG